MKGKTLLAPTDWSALSKRILSHSAELESHLVHSNADLINALSALSSLEEITRNSFAPEVLPMLEPEIASLEAPAPETPPRASGTQAPEISVRFQTAKSEYQPALRNQNLIDALLEFHQKAQRRKSPALSESARRGFAPAQLPRVEAELKPEAFRGSNSASSLPILRAKPSKA